MTELDERIRRAFAPVPRNAEQVDIGWATVASSMSEAEPTSPRRRRLVAPRRLVVIALAVVSMSSAALAAQNDRVRELIGLDDRPADRMRVFDDAPIGANDLSGGAQSLLPDGSVQLPDGTVIDPDEFRLVLAYQRGKVKVRLRSAPTRDGQVCMIFDAIGGATLSCSHGMRFNGHVTVGSFGQMRTGTFVYGVADDAVTGVRVRVGDREVPARLGRNGYLLHLPDFRAPTRGVEVDLADGTTLDLAMNGCLRSQLEHATSRLGCGYGLNKGPWSEVE